MAAKSSPSEYDPFIQQALKRFKACEDAEHEERVDALNDLEFLTGEQWPEDIRSARKREARPCLTMNKLPKLVAKIVNEQRQKKPSIVVSPIGSGADKDTARIINGIIRHIEDRSDAQDAYEYGYEISVGTGKGFWRVRSEYADDKTDDQELRVERIRNRFSVYFDPFAQSATYADARYAFVTEDIPRDEYKARYPNSQLASLSQTETVGNRPASWVTTKAIRVAEYWHVDETRKKGPTGRNIVDTNVICSVINAVEALEETEWLGSRIPIIPCIIEDLDVDGKRRVYGLIRNAKDAQRQYNYLRSAATEAIALAPKAPFVGVEGQFEGHEAEWSQANVRNYPYLEVKAVSVSGQPAPLPQRQAVEPPIQAIGMEGQAAAADLKDVTGIYEPQMGQPGPEQSARAILARQNRGDELNLEYSSALARAIRATGEILVDLIPKIYDAPRVVRIINPDGTASTAAVFNSDQSGVRPNEALEQLRASEGQQVERIYDLGVGRYHVSVSVGPSYHSRRQEAVASIMTLVNSFPQIVPVVGDLLVRTMDWPGADQIADRLAKMLPPQLQDGNDPTAEAAQLRQQLQAAVQQNEALAQKLQAAMDTVLARKIENDSRERIAQLQAQTQIVVQELKSRLGEAQARADQELDAFKEMHVAAHETAMAQAAQPQPAPTLAPQAPAQP